MEIDLMYNQLDNTIITQEHNETTFQTEILPSGKLDFLFLISQRHKHEAYTNQRMERVQVTSRNNIISNINPNNISNMVALAQNNGVNPGILRAKRWQNRSRLETLERYQNAPGILANFKSLFLNL